MPVPAGTPNPRNRSHLKKPYVKEAKTSSNSSFGSFLSYIFSHGRHSDSPLSTSGDHSSAYEQYIPMQNPIPMEHPTPIRHPQTGSMGNPVTGCFGNVEPPSFLDGMEENSSDLDSNNFNLHAGDSPSTSAGLGQTTVLDKFWTLFAEIEYGNRCSEARPSGHQIPHQLGEHAAPSEMAFAGQMANAEAGPSHGQNLFSLMDFGGQTTNAEIGPSDDQNSYYLGGFAAPMQPLSNVGIPYHEDTDDDIWGEWLTATLNTEAGPPDYEEDESYYDFGGGLDNPAAVQHVATMLDEMTGLNVATKLAEDRKYHTISDLNSGLNNGHAAGCKVEDVEKTSCALRALTPKLLPIPEHPDTVVKVVSFSKVSFSDARRMGLEFDSQPISMTVAKPILEARLSNLFASQLVQADLLRDFDNPSIASDLAVNISLISCTDMDFPEAFSRIIIDQFSLSMLKVFKSLNLAVCGAKEFRIASLENPVEILRGRFKTILTGYTDYAYFLQLDWEKSKLKDFCDSHHSRGVKVLLGKMRLNGVRIFMIEAKSREYSKNLEACLPQMGAECIATMKISQIGEMAWCLSTGSTWIFGVIIRDRVSDTYVMRMLQPMQVQLDAPNITVVHNILWSMICWSLVPVTTIIADVFSKPAESKPEM